MQETWNPLKYIWQEIIHLRDIKKDNVSLTSWKAKEYPDTNIDNSNLVINEEKFAI